MSTENKSTSSFEFKGKKLSLSITIGMARKLKDELGFDLLDPEQYSQSMVKFATPVFRLDLLWFLVKDALEGEYNQDQFEQTLDMECGCMDAMEAAIENFIQGLGAACSELWGSNMKTINGVFEKQAMALESVLTNERIEKHIDEAVNGVVEEVLTMDHTSQG